MVVGFVEECVRSFGLWDFFFNGNCRSNCCCFESEIAGFGFGEIEGEFVGGFCFGWGWDEREKSEEKLESEKKKEKIKYFFNERRERV